MNNLLLLEKAYIYPMPKDPTPPAACSFDTGKGFWISDMTAQPMVTLEDHPKLETKKADIETGEDRKGE